MSNQTSLFTDDTSPEPAATTTAYRPLAARMRPTRLEDILGQTHLLGQHALLHKLASSQTFGSILLFGPPGCGKTTLAEVIGSMGQSRFVRLNAVLSNVAELREILRIARYQGSSTTLFIDEIHRFNKSQQDLLLPDVEAGHIRLIGATTHNPSFYITAPLLSRSHLFRLEPLQPDTLVTILAKALSDTTLGLGHLRLTVDPAVLTAIAQMSQGDLRRGLNALETLAISQPIGGSIGQAELQAFANERHIRYDKAEDEHYDTISAFIKSVRGGDPDAALYWMTKMLEAGEDPRFVARRLLILASEDVGLADSRGLSVASAAFHACEVLGMPECAIPLSHATIFLATCPKSNSAYLALHRAQDAIRNQSVQSVPLHLRDGSTALNKALGYGKDYRYSHDYPEAISGQSYMEAPQQFYIPKAIGAEAAIAERLERWHSLKASTHT